ncbi:putative diphosphate--fructose-6-phosphate 1-phosphotransferase [Helianthus anomalus]
MERPRFSDHLEAIKFICKDFWSELFKKHIDNLKTNHRANDKFAWLSLMSGEPSTETRGSAPEAGNKAVETTDMHLYFPCGIIRGALYSVSLSFIFAIMSVKHYGRGSGSGATTLGKPFVHPATVDLRGKVYEQNATRFLLDDVYKNPGPLQFDGPGAYSKAVKETILKEGTYEGKKFNAICHFFGYQARGSLPSKLDCDYAYVLGHICYHILAAGLNGYMATITNLKSPSNKWRCGAAPITAMMTVKHYGRRSGSRATTLGKPFVHPATIDLIVV